MVPALTLGTALHLALRVYDATREAAVIVEARVRLGVWHLTRTL